MTPLTDIATSNGMTLNDLVQQCIGSAFEMGWFYEMNLGTRTVALTMEQYEEIRAAIGKEAVFGTDIANFIRNTGIVAGNTHPAAFAEVDH